MAVIDETKPAKKKPAAKPAAKKARVASISVPPAAQAKPKAKVAPADGIKKTAIPAKKVYKIPARLAKIFEGFAKGGLTRSESLGGKITKAQKEVLIKEAARMGVTPAALVAALVINFLDTCAE
jgi:hypothetical protein